MSVLIVVYILYTYIANMNYFISPCIYYCSYTCILLLLYVLLLLYTLYITYTNNNYCIIP